MLARHLILHGKVQGVFYRDWTVETARSIGLSGWVRNLADGTVEAHLEGDEGKVARMIEAMHDGPPRARVDRIEQHDAAPQAFQSFERR
ncbi:acylphosphatase [Citromicrobium bathyomarinum]|uniref:acylphosphatase n=1 Tax=Citromicrobium bathyomarinum TaxID=72174 RepID=UPI00315A9160